MKTTRYLPALLVLLMLGGCQDLAVDNPNNPDRQLALAEPGDVQALVSNTFSEFWNATQGCNGGPMLSTMADQHSCSWANWGMRDMSSEPRIAWNNSPSYSRRASTETPWFDNYRGISNAIDGLLAIQAAEEADSPDNNAFTRDGINTDRLKAFAKFSMGLLHGWLALQFDQAFVVDETVDLEAVALGTVELPARPYNEVMDEAIRFLDEAIAIAERNRGNAAFTISATDDWIYGLNVPAERLIRIANSYAARFLAQVARTPAERAAVDWAEVMRRVNAGITEDFAPISDDDGNREWDCLKWAGSEGRTWARADYYTIGPADESVCDGGDGKINCFQEWLDTPLEDRLVFDVRTADRRIVGSATDPTVSGKDFQYQGDNGPFPPARGTYHYSSHNHFRYKYYRDDNSNGPMPAMVIPEMDMLRAEAMLRMGGSAGDVAALINKTRVARGELNPATGSDPVGTPDDPQSHLDGASLWSKLKHEKRIEAFLTGAGVAFFDDRGWGDLVLNTPYHFPIPGKELETLALQIYTFGGPGGQAAAATPGAWKKGPEMGRRTMDPRPY